VVELVGKDIVENVHASRRGRSAVESEAQIFDHNRKSLARIFDHLLLVADLTVKDISDRAGKCLIRSAVLELVGMDILRTAHASSKGRSTPATEAQFSRRLAQFFRRLAQFFRRLAQFFRHSMQSP